jgi:tetratricopeptide (TPR) repeat protein
MNTQILLRNWSNQREQVLTQPAQALEWIKKANGIGEYRLAIEIAETVLAGDTTSCNPATLLAIKQKLAVALYRSGSTEKAKVILQGLLDEGQNDGETFGLLGSLYKILWGRSTMSEEKQQNLQTSHDFYRRGFEKTGEYYCGINAATLSVLLGDLNLGKQLATDTIKALPKEEDAWSVATEAEAQLILGNVDRARELYTRAVTMSKDRWADVVSTQRQCKLLCTKLGLIPSPLESCFPKNAVALFTGHMIDAPNRETPRFPNSAAPQVQDQIKTWLQTNNIRFAYGSAACGGDILFQEAAQQLGIETHVVLTFTADFFARASVERGGEEWLKRFNMVLEKATSVTILNDDVPDDEQNSSYEYTNQMIAAMASAREAACDGDLLGLALWDGLAGDGPGGTSGAVAYWNKGKIPVSVLHPTDGKPIAAHEAGTAPTFDTAFPAVYTASPNSSQTIVATMLFLRLTGYHSIREKDFGSFTRKVLRPLSELIVEKGWFPARYGFGDQYLFIWDSQSDSNNVVNAGLAGLEFASRIQAGLNDSEAKIEFALCLDTAPVQMMVNPILNQYAHEGVAISKLGLLAEKLTPGAIYATESFAGISAFEKIRDFRCEYFGTINTSLKSSGTRLFHLVK